MGCLSVREALPQRQHVRALVHEAHAPVRHALHAPTAAVSHKGGISLFVATSLSSYEAAISLHSGTGSVELFDTVLDFGPVPTAALDDAWHWWLLQSSAAQTQLLVDNQPAGAVPRPMGFQVRAAAGLEPAQGIDDIGLWPRHLAAIERVELLTGCASNLAEAQSLADLRAMEAGQVASAFDADLGRAIGPDGHRKHARSCWEGGVP